jgi:putative ABC transport system substrate-binding protein
MGSRTFRVSDRRLDNSYTFQAPAFLAAHSISIDFVARQVRNDAQIEDEIGALARQGAAGLVTLTDSFMTAHGQTVIDSAASHRVPALYANRSFTRRGGLMAYAVDYPDLIRRAASYVDRILRGDKPGDMPVQQPTKFELSINVITAKARLGYSCHRNCSPLLTVIE